MKRVYVYVLLMTLLMAASAVAEEYRHHSMVKVIPGSETRLRELYKLSGRLDIVPGEQPDQPYVSALPEDLELLDRFGFRYEILHEDIEQFYASRLNVALETDSLGGYHTYHDIMMYMDSLSNIDTQGIIGARFSIGQTGQGRDIWACKISDNPDVDEDEPEVFYNSMTHAREPAGMEAVLLMMRYLVINYGSNQAVTDLVNNREFYFVPCMNPDGYEYNRSTNPQGGGMWRKSRSDNGGGQIGVDLNRNYGYAWGLDNDGSTSDPSTGNYTYRGPYEFSEPETQVIRDFCNSRQFALSIDYHTYSNLILYPWGTSYFDGDGLTVDNTTFEMMGDSMRYWISTVNGVQYSVGTAWQLLYNTNGGSFDWEYGEQVDKWKMYSVSTEVGGPSDGFWPPQNRIWPLANENLPANLFLARISAQLQPPTYAASRISHCQSEWNGDGDGVTEPGEGMDIAVTLRNLGRWTLSSLSGQITSGDPYVTVVTDNASWPTLDPLDTSPASSAFRISISSSCPPERVIALNLELTATGYDSILTFNIGVGASAFSDNVEAGQGGWTTGGTSNQWHISTARSASATHSWFCGSDGGTYNDNMSAYLQSPVFVLSPGDQIEYDQWYAFETGYDVGYLEIDRGRGWKQIGLPTTGSSGWQHVLQDLGITCPGTKVQIRFRAVTDGFTAMEGWYVDNIQVGRAPELSLSIPQVSPSTGDLSTVFTYSVIYTSPTNQAPQSASLYIDGVPQTMTTSDFTYSDGSLFTYSGTLPSGQHDYYVLFEGLTMSVRQPAEGVLSGPVVGQPIFCYDFETDQGWTAGATGDNATSGIWNRADPEPTSENGFPVQPGDDHTAAPGVTCYVTDSRAGTSSGQYDVDGGKTTLLSPVMDLSGYLSVALDMWTWYTNQRGNNGGQDSFRVDISSDGGTSWIGLTHTTASWEYWKNDLYFLEDIITLSSQVRLRFVAEDAAPGSLVEAAVDDICLFNTGSLDVPQELTIAYNPDDSTITLRWVNMGAPGYAVYSAPQADGPFTNPVGTTAGTSLTIPVPTDGTQFYIVVSTDSPEPVLTR